MKSSLASGIYPSWLWNKWGNCCQPWHNKYTPVLSKLSVYAFSSSPEPSCSAGDLSLFPDCAFPTGQQHILPRWICDRWESTLYSQVRLKSRDDDFREADMKNKRSLTWLWHLWRNSSNCFHHHRDVSFSLRYSCITEKREPRYAIIDEERARKIFVHLKKNAHLSKALRKAFR